MGSITLVNNAQCTVRGITLSVNNAAQSVSPDELSQDQSVEVIYTELSAKNFQDLKITMNADGNPLSLDLDAGNWFGGQGVSHYPGVDTNITLTFEKNRSGSIWLQLTYYLDGKATVSSDQSKVFS